MAAPEPDPQLAWARSGAMALTGEASGTPRLAPGPLALFAARELASLARAARSEALASLDAAALLGERAALAGLRRRGRISAGGSCRLLRARDAWLAVNLPRKEDLALLPAWLESDADAFAARPWETLAERCAVLPAGPLVARGRLCGLAVASVATPPEEAPPPHRVAARGPRRSAAPPLRVVDLSALWAGPLCTQLLGLAGADVCKVESPQRPDGARFGPAAFFDLLNAGKHSVALDLRQAGELAALRRLIARADIVVESARPRALAQLGLCAEECVAEMPGLVWVSITGYGRRHDRVAFGDDAACAAGLATASGDCDAPVFCSDAAADPLAGIYAASAAFAARAAGGGVLLDIALRDVAAHAAGGPRGEARVVSQGDGHAVESAAGCEPVAEPRARTPRGPARPLGADTRALLC